MWPGQWQPGRNRWARGRVRKVSWLLGRRGGRSSGVRTAWEFPAPVPRIRPVCPRDPTREARASQPVPPAPGHSLSSSKAFPGHGKGVAPALALRSPVGHRQGGDPRARGLSAPSPRCCLRAPRAPRHPFPCVCCRRQLPGAADWAGKCGRLSQAVRFDVTQKGHRLFCRLETWAGRRRAGRGGGRWERGGVGSVHPVPAAAHCSPGPREAAAGAGSIAGAGQTLSGAAGAAQADGRRSEE